MARILTALAREGRLVKFARCYWLPRADGQAISVILITVGNEEIVSGIKPGQEVVSNALLMRNKVEP
jgi:hypothetical protein